MAAPIPNSFREYLRSFGPGLVVVLTWLGAGDIVDMGVAGGNFGYSLIWLLILALAMRYMLVSLIARYQLCNQHGEGVLDGLVRLNRGFAPLLLVAAFVLGHLYGAYMTRGIGEACRNVTGVGEIWQWAVAWNGLALVLVLRPTFQRLELMFKLFLAMLAVSFIGTAVWVGPNLADILGGVISLEVPAARGKFGPLLLGVSMIGAILGSLMNLVYPYFLESKGWNSPAYRRVQRYDLLLAMAAMFVLNLAVWTLGAELMYPDKTISEMDDLPSLLSTVLGPSGRVLFYVGIFAAVFTSLVGHALGLAYLGSHAWQRWQSSVIPTTTEIRGHRLYTVIATWCLISPLIWTAPGLPGFVTLTIVVNALQVVLLPVIALGLLWITADARIIGLEHRNRWWDNVGMALVVLMSLFMAFKAVTEVYKAVTGF